jgi:uncharacterized RDD family membrane protein YckC
MRMIEKRVSTILKGIDVPEKDKNEIKRELISSYIDASATKARARGASLLERTDVALAFEESSDPEEIASMYMASYVKSLKRAGLLPRIVAYIIDTIITTLLTMIVALPIMALRVVASPLHGGHTVRVTLFSDYFFLIIYLNLIVVFIYFVVCEGFFGFTPGKRVLGLKVLRSDGRKAGYREAMLRTIPKLFVLVIIADTTLMVLYHGNDKQRIFDRIAGTIVIRK